MSKIEITGGSEKQNAWASKIAADWLAELDVEITNNVARPESHGMRPYIAKLNAARQSMLDGLAKITAKQVIDLHVAKRNPVRLLIAAARKN